MEWKLNYGSTGMSMNNQKRTIFVLVSLVASMTIGALLLMALDQQTPSSGAYSLASYLRLDPIENATDHRDRYRLEIGGGSRDDRSSRA